ncbi:hypothetical protein NQD34_006653 [Periophthalmus magnuspinnatus]|nr:hypothetical protein NQD34_006653 [Periophthalmus magnuspinnatus]
MSGYRPKENITEKFGSLGHIMETKYKLSSLEEDKDVHAATLLLRKMLEPDLHKRITPAQILRHLGLEFLPIGGVVCLQHHTSSVDWRISLFLNVWTITTASN